MRKIINIQPIGHLLRGEGTRLVFMPFKIPEHRLGYYSPDILYGNVYTTKQVEQLVKQAKSK